MAWRNIFRFRKRFFVTVLSLFLGITVSLGAVVISKGTDQTNQINYENADFKVLSNMAAPMVDVYKRQEQDLEIDHDPNWLGEAVYNLLDNSVKYSPENAVVDISITTNEMFTQISVRDYGMGIEAEEENLIFKRFYRGKKVTVQEGFGLGLYLAREIIMDHDGFMKAKREKKGMTISIYLPV